MLPYCFQQQFVGGSIALGRYTLYDRFIQFIVEVWKIGADVEKPQIPKS